MAQFPVLQEARPLAIGIHKGILERLPDLDKQKVSKAMRLHTASTRYLKAMAKGGPRYDLEGNPAGEVTAEQQEAAAKMVKERIERGNEKRKAEQERLKEEEQTRRQQEKLRQLADKFNKR